jgi:hypothetical protein
MKVQNVLHVYIIMHVHSKRFVILCWGLPRLAMWQAYGQERISGCSQILSSTASTTSGHKTLAVRFAAWNDCSRKLGLWSSRCSCCSKQAPLSCSSSSSSSSSNSNSSRTNNTQQDPTQHGQVLGNFIKADQRNTQQQQQQEHQEQAQQVRPQAQHTAAAIQAAPVPMHHMQMQQQVVVKQALAGQRRHTAHGLI